MSDFTIVVDTNCDLPEEYISEYGIEIIPMPFELDGAPHSQGYWQKISGKEFYNALREGKVATTSQINPEFFISIFKDYAIQGRDAVFLLLSGGLSNTYNSALIAAREVKESYPESGIYIIDTINATVGHGLLAILAAKKRAEGFSAAETARWLERKKHSCFGVFTVDDLMFLHRGGRLSKLSAIAGSVLRVKPILNLAPDGTLALKNKARSKKNAMKMMIDQMKRSVNPDTRLDTVLIAHTDCAEDALVFADMIKDAADPREIINMMVGPVIGAHLGPGALVLLFEADMTREEYERKYYQ